MDTQVVSRKMSQLKLRTSSYRFSLLLCGQFALIAIAPLVRNTERDPSTVFNVFAFALLLTALNFVIEKRRLRAVAFVLCSAEDRSGILRQLRQGGRREAVGNL